MTLSDADTPLPHVHEGEWCRACVQHGADTMLAGIAEAESVRATLDATRAAGPGLREAEAILLPAILSNGIPHVGHNQLCHEADAKLIRAALAVTQPDAPAVGDETP